MIHELFAVDEDLVVVAENAGVNQAVLVDVATAVRAFTLIGYVASDGLA